MIPPLGGPRPAPGDEVALDGGSVAEVSVVAPSDCGGAIELSVVVAGVEPLLAGVVPAPLVMSPGLAALVGELEPETTVGSEAVVAVVVGAVATTGVAVATPPMLKAPVPVVAVATGTVFVSTDVTVCVTGTWTVWVVVVVSTVVVGTVLWVTAGWLGVEELTGASDVWVEVGVGAGDEIGALVVGAGVVDGGGVVGAEFDGVVGAGVDGVVVALGSAVWAAELVSSAWRA